MLSAWLLTLALSGGPALPVATAHGQATRAPFDSTRVEPVLPEHSRGRSALAGAWNVTAAPLLTPRTARILAAGAVLTGGALLIEDPERTARALEQPGLDQASDFGNLYGNGVTLGSGVLVLLAIGAGAHNARCLAAGTDAVRALGAAYVAVGALKLAVRRTRPDGGSYSFPSGHTAGAFAIAPVLADHFGRKVGYPAYALAVMTGLGRLEDRRHYLSDVVFGAALGTAAGVAFSGSHSAGAPALSVTLHGGQPALTLRF